MRAPSLGPDATVVAAGDLLTTEFANELVILNLRDGVYYSLEEVGARVWMMLREPVAVRELCAAIVREYDVAADRCEADVRSLLASLIAHGLAELRATP
jgi:hypothetical protein